MKKSTISSLFCILCTSFYSTNLAAQDVSVAVKEIAQLPIRSTVSVLESAQIAYERNHWIDAFANYAELADTGHPLASRIAYQMWRHDKSLYKTEFKVTPDQIMKWRNFL